MSNTLDEQERRPGDLKDRKKTTKTAMSHSGLIASTGYFFLLTALALALAGPPLYDPNLVSRWAFVSALSSTIVPEVLELSLQPMSGKCEPMKIRSKSTRPRRKHAVLMLASLGSVRA
jgi:hypothetical protein